MQQTEAKGGSCDERGRHCEIYYHVKASCRVSCGMWIKHNGKDRVMWTVHDEVDNAEFSTGRGADFAVVPSVDGTV